MKYSFNTNLCRFLSLTGIACGLSAANVLAGDLAVDNLTVATNLTVGGNITLSYGSVYIRGGEGLIRINPESGNNFFGVNAGNSTMTGDRNFAAGEGALSVNTTGTRNCAVGFGALYVNTVGNNNTGNGHCALENNISGGYNVANGNESLIYNTVGNCNVAIGTWALYQNTNGNYNIALGHRAGQNIMTGNYNIDIGNDGVAGDSGVIRIGSGNHSHTYIAGVVHLTNNLLVNGSIVASSISGNASGLTNLNATQLTGTVPLAQLPSNVITNGQTQPVTINTNLTVTGNLALINGSLYTANGESLILVNSGLGNNFFGLNNGNTVLTKGYTMTGGRNVSVGENAFYSNTTGIGNSGIGFENMRDNTVGSYNTANGHCTLQRNVSGNSNVANGNSALIYNTVGNCNVAIGTAALSQNTNGNYNVALGHRAGQNITIGNYNIDIGNDGVSGDSGVIRIGSGNHSHTYIAGVVHLTNNVIVNGSLTLSSNIVANGSVTATNFIGSAAGLYVPQLGDLSMGTFTQ